MLEHDYVIGAALDAGFDVCGVAVSGPVDPALRSHFTGRLERGCYGTMEWLGRHADMRFDPGKLMEGARSVVVCGKGYTLYGSGASVASYAMGEDYHRELRRLLERVCDALVRDGAHLVRPFVDSAPVAERYWAVKAGLGAIGHSGMVINSSLGGAFLICGVVTDAECDRYDTPSAYDPCGTCGRCAASCPSGAIEGRGVIDASKCRSYLTIEHRGELSPAQAAAVGGGTTVFGCDECLKVCPHNKIAKAPIPHPFDIGAREWLAMGSGRFKREYGHTPMSRISVSMLRRNAALVSGSDAAGADAYVAADDNPVNAFAADGSDAEYP